MVPERIRLTVNGKRHTIQVAPNRALLDVLREELRLTGSKRGCDDSSCGACTVLVDGTPMLSCVMLPASYQDCEIITIEGVAQGEELHPLQEGFCVGGGAQCGFCTPGILLTAKALLEENPNPTRAEIAAALSGNLCRCTGYEQIYESVEFAIRKLQQESAAAVGGRK